MLFLLFAFASASESIMGEFFIGKNEDGYAHIGAYNEINYEYRGEFFTNFIPYTAGYGGFGALKDEFGYFCSVEPYSYIVKCNKNISSGSLKPNSEGFPIWNGTYETYFEFIDHSDGAFYIKSLYRNLYCSSREYIIICDVSEKDLGEDEIFTSF